jgi:hypothetical protein
MSTNQDPKPGTETPGISNKDLETVNQAVAEGLFKAFQDAHKRTQEQKVKDIFVDTSTTLILENVAKALASEVERLYKTRQTNTPDVRENNALLDTLMAGMDKVDYEGLRLLTNHFRSGCALRRAVRTEVR